MSKTFLIFFAVACLFLGARAFASETNSTPSPANADSVNAFLQIQAQLHETQMMVESNRQEMVATLQHNADILSARVQLLEQTIAGQRAGEVESARRVEQMMLMLAAVGMLALAAVVTMIFLQLRAATRLVELAVSSPALALNNSRTLPVVESAAALPLSARAAVESSNTRLLGVIERLEKRILEFEQTARVPLNEDNSHDATNGETPGEHRAADLIAEGQLFLDTDKPEKALRCFDAALDIQPKLAEALIKKGAALEKLGKTDEAILCYDRAIEADRSATMALLQKGGLLNRLARYDEALQCYESALQTRENTLSPGLYTSQMQL